MVQYLSIIYMYIDIVCIYIYTLYIKTYNTSFKSYGISCFSGHQFATSRWVRLSVAMGHLLTIPVQEVNFPLAMSQEVQSAWADSWFIKVFQQGPLNLQDVSSMFRWFIHIYSRSLTQWFQKSTSIRVNHSHFYLDDSTGVVESSLMDVWWLFDQHKSDIIWFEFLFCLNDFHFRFCLRGAAVFSSSFSSCFMIFLLLFCFFRPAAMSTRFEHNGFPICISLDSAEYLWAKKMGGSKHAMESKSSRENTILWAFDDNMQSNKTWFAFCFDIFFWYRYSVIFVEYLLNISSSIRFLAELTKAWIKQAGSKEVAGRHQRPHGHHGHFSAVTSGEWYGIMRWEKHQFISILNGDGWDG